MITKVDSYALMQYIAKPSTQSMNIIVLYKRSNLLSQSLHIRQTWLTRSLTLFCVSRVSFLLKKDTQNDLTKRFFYLCKQHKHDILCALPRYIIIYTKINNQPHLSQSLMARGSELIFLSNINTLQNTLILIWCK